MVVCCENSNKRQTFSLHDLQQLQKKQQKKQKKDKTKQMPNKLWFIDKQIIWVNMKKRVNDKEIKAATPYNLYWL